MQAKIDELWQKTLIAVAFMEAILCVSTHATRKLEVVKGRFTYLTIAIISEISILLVRSVCEIRSSSYESKHGTQLFFDTFCA